MGEATVTWEQIRGQFTEEDVEHMLAVTGNKLNLDDCSSVGIWAHEIFARVSAGNMPPPPRTPWSKEWIQNFDTWMNAGCKCS